MRRFASAPAMMALDPYPDTTTIAKQPADIVDVAMSFAAWTSKYNTAVASALAFASRARTSSTTVNGTNTAGATTLNLNAHPGVGALLTVNPGQATQEKLLVSAVSGVGPYACTVSPLQFAHDSPQVVDYYPGVSARVLVSTAGTVNGDDAIFRLRRAAAFWTGEHQYTIDQVLALMIARAAELKLRLSRPPQDVERDALIVLTMHVMNYLNAGLHRIAL